MVSVDDQRMTVLFEDLLHLLQGCQAIDIALPIDAQHTAGLSLSGPAVRYASYRLSQVTAWILGVSHRFEVPVDNPCG